MPDWIEVVILGIIEGVTEFLPISSTGHLLIAEHWLGHRSDLFNIFIQAGAVVAVVMIYWNHVLSLIFEWKKPENLDYLLKLGTAFGITGFLGYAVSKGGYKLPNEIEPIAWAVVLGAFAIFAVESYAKKNPGTDIITWKLAILVGLAQVLAAIFPGTSRSAACILVAMLAGADRKTATEFSFLVGIPSLFAAAGYSVLKARSEIQTLGSQELFNLALGFAVSLLVAFLVVKWLLKYIQTHTFHPFAWYRLALGISLLIYAYF
jgi:undecaprenyl-diphosphatase